MAVSLFPRLSPLALFLGFTSVAHAQDAPAAASPEFDLASVVIEAGFPAQPDVDGDFPVGVTFQDGRSQSGWVLSGELDVKGMVVREVRSVAAILPRPLSKKNMSRLLMENGQTVGAWQVYPNGKLTYVVYSIHVPANVDAKTLDGAIALALSFADQEEAILTKADVN